MTAPEDADRTARILEEAVRAHRAGRLRDAAAAYCHVLAGRPDEPHARHLLGVVFRQSGHPAEAARTIAQALAVAPGLAEAYLNRGLALLSRSPPEAAAAYRRALRLNPGLETARVLLRGPLDALDGWRLEETDEDIACVAPGTPDAAELVERLRERLRASPQTDLAFPDGDPADGEPEDGDPADGEGSWPPGLWLARQIERTGYPTPPSAAVLRRSFIERVLLGTAPPDAGWSDAAVWGLIAASASTIAVALSPASPPATAEVHRRAASAAADGKAADGEVSLLCWLRRMVGRVNRDPAVARLLRRALTVRLVDATWNRPEDRLDQWFPARSPVPVLRRALSSLPSPGTIRMARSVLRLALPATVAAVAAHHRPPGMRSVHGLARSIRGVVPLYAFDAPGGNLDGLAQRWDRWCYIGLNSERMEELANGALRGIPCIPSGPLLERTARRYRDGFAAAWSRLLDERPNRWAIMVAEQNPETATLFVNLCHVLTAVDLFRSNEEPADAGRLLVVVEQPALFQTAIDILMPDPATAPWPDLAGALSAEIWSLLRRYTRDARRWHRHLAALAGCRSAGPPGPPGPPGPDADVLMVSYLDNQSIGRDGRWRDRYFGPLPGWLRERGLTVRWLWFDWTRAIPADRLAGLTDGGSGEPGIAYQELAGWPAVVRAMLEKINAWRTAPQLSLTVDGHDLGPLLRMELRWAIGIPLDIDRLLFRRIGPVLAARGSRIGRILYPFENQGWEKMLCTGVRRRLPATRLTGYAHANFSLFHLSYYPPSGFWASPRRPDRVVALSPSVAEHMAASGYPAGTVVPSGALRYRHLFSRAVAETAGADAVLAVLPNAPAEAVDLFHVLVRALGPQDGRPVLLKLHPATVHRVGPLLHPLPAHFRIIAGSMEDAMAACSVAVYNFGTAGLEILAAGIPVVCTTPLGRLPHLSLPEGGPLAYAATAPEIAAAVERFATLAPEQRRELAHRARALAGWWFAPPEPEQAADFLG